MAYGGLTFLAVVPARGGSKSIPRKNLCRVGGLSLVARAALVAKSLSWLDCCVLSTDDDEIAEEGRRNGLDVPFLRPIGLSGDFSTSVDVWRHAWLTSEEIYGCRYDASVLLEPTSPLRTPGDVERTVSVLVEGGYHAAATVSRTPAHYRPHKTLVVEGGHIGFYMEDGAEYSIRQNIPVYYHRNGICYAVVRETLVERGHILQEDCAAVIIDRPVVNIDEPFEIDLAEWLLSSLGKGIR